MTFRSKHMRLFAKSLATHCFGEVRGGCKPYGWMLKPAASYRERAAHHAAGHPQNRSFNQGHPCDRGISPVARCSNAFTPLGDNHGR